MNSPIAIADVGLREQPTLDARCKLEIAFQSALFFAAEVIEAQAHEWINDEPFLLNGIVTDVATAIVEVLDNVPMISSTLSILTSFVASSTAGAVAV